MLYITTRNDRDAFTVQHVLTQNNGEDGGLYLPLHFPKFTEEELQSLCAVSFNQRVAAILNLFFSSKLTGWDVDFCAGRYPVRVQSFPCRIHMAELWHNPCWQYEFLEQNLLRLIGAQTDAPDSWCRIAVRMAVLAGILGEHSILGNGSVDVALVSGDFGAPISAWYLQKMGFPIGSIICCCNENNQLWELICHGQMPTEDMVIPTLIPEADVVHPVNLERLLHGFGGSEEVKRYLDCVQNRVIYSVSDGITEVRKVLYAGVVSSDRIESAIPNVYNSYQYLITPASALAYSGLIDYRSKTGVTRSAVVVCDRSPVCEQDLVAKIMNITPEIMKNMI